MAIVFWVLEFICGMASICPLNVHVLQFFLCIVSIYKEKDIKNVEP